jgi:quinol monooxygenase YgiN
VEEAEAVKVLAVQVFMKPEHREAFIEEMLKDAVGSEKNEPGCLMFNVAQDEADANVLHLFEVYADGDAVDAHTKTPHFLGWVEATKDWQTKPFAISKCTTLYPPDAAWKKRPAP